MGIFSSIFRSNHGRLWVVPGCVWTGRPRPWWSHMRAPATGGRASAPSSCAIRKTGYSVNVSEKNISPRPKPCCIKENMVLKYGAKPQLREYAFRRLVPILKHMWHIGCALVGTGPWHRDHLGGCRGGTPSPVNCRTPRCMPSGRVFLCIFFATWKFNIYKKFAFSIEI